MKTDVEALHRSRLEQVLTEAESLAGTMTQVANKIRQVLAEGGTVNCQPQMSFLTGAHARMLKDLGVIEQLQQAGVFQKKRMGR